jgi:hypothetical protein
VPVRQIQAEKGPLCRENARTCGARRLARVGLCGLVRGEHENAGQGHERLGSETRVDASMVLPLHIGNGCAFGQAGVSHGLERFVLGVMAAPNVVVACIAHARTALT